MKHFRRVFTYSLLTLLTIIALSCSTGSKLHGQKYHIVGQGDSLFKVAKQYNTTVEVLQKLNPKLKNFSNWKIGLKLKLPSD